MVPTFSGLRVDVMNPDPKTLTIKDVAHHLAKVNRYIGATKRPYSVAEHSVRLALVMGSKWLSEALMHDATEAYLGDVSATLKRLPAFEVYREIERTLEVVIWQRFELQQMDGTVSLWDKALSIVERNHELFTNPDSLPVIYTDQRITSLVPTIQRALQCYPECDVWGWHWTTAFDMFMGVARRAGLTRI